METNEHETIITLYEGVLNDDEIAICENGYHYSNNGRKCRICVTYWTYRNSWCNDKHQFCATTLQNALNRYNRETKHTRLTPETRMEIEFLVNDLTDL